MFYEILIYFLRKTQYTKTLITKSRVNIERQGYDKLYFFKKQINVQGIRKSAKTMEINTID
jgi:hypothetical protein